MRVRQGLGISLGGGHQNNEKKLIKSDCFGCQVATLTHFKKDTSTMP